MESSDPIRRGPLDLLREGRFLGFFLSVFISGSGNWLHVIASGIIVFNLTGSSLAVGIVGVAQFGAFLVMTPIAGRLADAFDRRHVLIVSNGIASLAAAGLAFSTWRSGPQVGVIIGVTVVLGLGHAVSVPSVLTIVPLLVKSAELSVGIALNTVAVNLARVFGPIAGAFLYAQAGATTVFALNALTYLPIVFVMLAVPPAPRRDPGAEGSSAIGEALRLIRRDRGLKLAFLAVFAMGYALDPMTTLAPAAAVRLGQAESFVGFIVSAFGFGAIVTVGVATRLRWVLGPVRTGAAGLTVMGLGLIGWSVLRSPGAAILAIGFIGLGYIMSVTDITTFIQERVADRLRGRMMALWSAVLLGPRPVAATLNGALADGVGVGLALAIAGLVPLGIGLTLLAGRPPGPAPAEVETS